jgi:hypothetical protein
MAEVLGPFLGVYLAEQVIVLSRPEPDRAALHGLGTSGPSPDPRSTQGDSQATSSTEADCHDGDFPLLPRDVSFSGLDEQARGPYGIPINW